MGASSTFSAVNLDRGALAIGPNGIVLTSQVSAQRVDLVIPDQIFQFNLGDNGTERVTSKRDFINEWIYFTYSSSNFNTSLAENGNYFPNQTLLFNYRDNSWGIFNESYTTYGTFRRLTGETWDDLDYFIWDDWTDPWDSGEVTLNQPEVIAGNQQGYVMVRAEGTGENPSGYIQSFAGSVVTSPNHNLQDGDYIFISDCIGTIGNEVNNRIFSVTNPGTNTFTLNPTIGAGTYFGTGQFTRMYVPLIQTKQFPVAWGYARKTRLGPQQYLLTTTSLSQVTLLIFLSQDGGNPYNLGPIVPSLAGTNNALIYDTVLYTCPESTNLGLTAANVNLQMPLAQNQAQIWHRMNTSLLGDTVQIGITLSDVQMRTFTQTASSIAITNTSQATQCIVDCVNTFIVGQIVKIENVQGMFELNNRTYTVLAATPTQITIDVDSTAFNAYTSGGIIYSVAPIFQFDEIELHSFILDVNPSQLLA